MPIDKMMDYSYYESQASSVKIEDITSDAINAEIIRKLKGNDPEFTRFWFRNIQEDDDDYIPHNACDAGWLGYFVGKSKSLDRISLNRVTEVQENIITEDTIESFCRGLSHNRSITSIRFHNFNLLGGMVFQLLVPFFKHNHNLPTIEMDHCDLGAEGGRYLSLALAGCKCLERFELTACGVGDEQFADIVVALSMHRKLESLDLNGNHIGRNGCMALETLLNWSATELNTLDLRDNDIDDEGVDALVGALLHHNKLQKLDLEGNQSITARGLRAVSKLLESPSTNLKSISLDSFGDEEARVFARALAKNSKLEELDLWGSSITATGWAAFAELLCDTSSVNRTFYSNHNLKEIHGEGRPKALSDLLEMNKVADKKSVAIRKVLRYHDDFDMKPLFEWEFKTLRSVIQFFERAVASYHARSYDYNSSIERRKLSAIYQFVRGMPVLYVEAHTRKEIQKLKAEKMEFERKQLLLQSEQMELSSKLNEIEESMIRATRRL